MNNGDRTFRDASHLLGVDLRPDLSSGLATADIDNDGFPDLLIVRAVAHGAPVLLRSRGNENAWIEIRTAGTTSDRDGIGARVEVLAGDLRQSPSATACTC